MKFRKAIKLLSTVLASALIFSSVLVFTGCSKKSINGRAINVEIKKDDPWYDLKTIDLQSAINHTDYDEINCDKTVICGDHLFTTYMAYSYGGNNMSGLYVCDLEGKKIADAQIGSEGSDISVLGSVGSDDNIAIYYRDSNYMEGTSTIYRLDCDPSTGNVGEPKKLDINFPGDGYVSSSTQVGDKMVFLYALYSGNQSYLEVMKGDDLLCEVDLNKEIGSSQFSYISNITGDGDNLVVNIQTDSAGYACTIEPSGSFKAEKVDSGIGMDHSTYIGKDGKTYELRFDGIYVDDELYFDFNDSYVSLYSVARGEIISVTEDQIIINSNDYDPTTSRSSSNVFIFSKAEKNPNAGKTVITASSAFWGVDKVSSDGMAKFNQENKDYFIKCSCKEYPEDEAAQEQYVTNYCMDLLADDGPDIIFKPDYLGDIKYEEYFLDLGQDIKLSDDLYYTAVVDGSKKDDKLYFVPLSFGTSGIITDRSNVKDGAKGFTFEEYKEFVSTTCNGTDPMNDYFSRRSEYFMECFRSMDDLWFKDGKVDLNQDAFTELLDYIKYNVPQDTEEEEGDDDGVIFIGGPTSDQAALYTYISSPSELYWQINNSNFKSPCLMGIPSADGRGASYQIYDSVAVNSSTAVKEGCVEFINVLLSDEIQEQASSIPLSRAAAKKQADTFFEIETDRFEKQLNSLGVDEATLRSWGTVRPDPAVMDCYLEMIDGLTNTVPYYEDSLNNVIIEEGNAYFSGDRDAAELIPQLENRIQTYLNENE